ncbi:MAG: hypothetical protein NTX42_11500 [Methanothrix sp.]|nr:hypothetical protein [Methanothrix sp.]
MALKNLGAFLGKEGDCLRALYLVQEMEAPEELRDLARDGLRKIAARKLKARGPRKDGGLPVGIVPEPLALFSLPLHQSHQATSDPIKALV